MPGRKLSPKDPLSKISAREWNRHVDVADLIERRQRLGQGGRQSQQTALPPDCVMIRNSTGYDLRAGDPVKITGTLAYGGVVVDVPYYSAGSPVAQNDDDAMGVTVAPIPSGEIGRVKMAGALPTYATISDSIERPYLAPIGTGGKLKPSWWGQFEIVYADNSTNGEKLVLARICPTQTPIYKARTKATIAPNTSGNAGIYVGGSEQETLTAHFNWMEGTTSLANNTECLITWFRDEAKWVIINAEC